MALSEMIRRQLLQIIPGKWIGALEFLSGSHHRFYPWGAMNGQTARLETARAMIQDLAIERIIETGTYRGTTTEWLASFGLPVTTIEISPRFHAFARRRLRRLPNVEVRLGESSEVLRAFSQTLDDKAAATLVYLDAHWKDHLPLGEELEIIFSTFTNPYVLVDDFQVPDDAGYEFDDYGPEKRLTLEYVAGHYGGDVHAFFPQVAAQWETGRKRGWVVLAGNEACAEKLSRIPGLRRWHAKA